MGSSVLHTGTLGKILLEHFLQLMLTVLWQSPVTANSCRFCFPRMLWNNSLLLFKDTASKGSFWEQYDDSQWELINSPEPSVDVVSEGDTHKEILWNVFMFESAILTWY